MSISIQCGSCKAKHLAQDKLAGKRVRCPKCGQAISVPGVAAAAVAAGAVAAGVPVLSGAARAGAEAITAAAPQSHQQTSATAAPTARRDKPAQSVRLPLLSYEELKVPSRLRRSIEKEVGDEELVWLGRPSPQSLIRKSWIAMAAGLVITILTGVGLYFGLTGVAGMENVDPSLAALIVWGVAGLVLLTMGLPMLTMPVWVRWLINYRDCYALTATRAIVFDNEKILSATAKSFTAQRLQNRHLHVKDDGSGSIHFGDEVVDLGLRERRRTTIREGPQGEKIRVTTTTRWREKASKSVGFLDIQDVGEVEAMLRQVLDLGPPASKDVD